MLRFMKSNKIIDDLSKGVCISFLIASMVVGFSVDNINAQSKSVELDIQLNDIITRAQALSLSTLGMDPTGAGQQIGTFFLGNNTNQTQQDLYFHITVKNTSVGVIAELDQRQQTPFKLQPGQFIRASINELRDGIPSIAASLRFSGGLTPQGEEFVNQLEGQTRLPDDIYTLTIEIYQGGNRLGNGNLLASATATVGEDPLNTTQDIYINSPGGEAQTGVDFVVYNENPQFDWSGGSNETYRIVIVKAQDSESPESIIAAAQSTDPVLIDNRSTGSTLLENEMADIQLSNSSFRYPSSGVKRLKSGEKYYWQVTTLVDKPEGEERVYSEIWGFKISDQQAQGTEELSENMLQALQTLVGDEAYNRIVNQDMELKSVVIDGQTYSGPEMIQQLRNLHERLRQGEITISKRQ